MIYYDTDGIMENQVRNFKVCKKCNGIETIDSSSDRGYHIFAITIPREACSTCIDEAYRLFNNRSNKYSNVYLQDRVNDEYLAR